MAAAVGTKYSVQISTRNFLFLQAFMLLVKAPCFWFLPCSNAFTADILPDYPFFFLFFSFVQIEKEKKREKVRSTLLYHDPSTLFYGTSV